MEYVLCLKEKYYEEIAGDNIGEVSKEVLHLFKTSEDYQSYERPYSFFIGKDGDIKITGTEVFFHVNGRKIEIIGEPEKELIYLNKRRLMEKTFNIIRGDCLLAGECRIVFQNGFIKIYSDPEKYKCSLMPVEKAQVPFEGFPEYKRSPRIIKRVPKDTIEIKSPPENAKIDKNGLIMTVMPPLTSSAVTVGVGLLIGRGNYLLMSIGITFVTVIF